MGGVGAPKTRLLIYRMVESELDVMVYALRVANAIAPTANAEMNRRNAKNPRDDARKDPKAMIVPMAINMPATEMPRVMVEVAGVRGQYDISFTENLEVASRNFCAHAL